MKTGLLLALGTTTFAAPLTTRQFGSWPSFGSGSSGFPGLGGGSSSGGSTPSFGSGGLSGGLGGSTANDLDNGDCKDVIMIFARGSTEIGNMGSTVGPATASGVKQHFGADKVAIQGVPYAASIGTNAIPGGTDSASKKLMADLILKAHDKCPDSAIVVGGYSQGAAVTHRAVENLDDAVKDQIAAAFMFGDTQNTQDKGQIPNFPKDKTIIICNSGDAVCKGTLSVLPAHLAYQPRVSEAVEFVDKKVEEWQSNKGSKKSSKKRDEESAHFSGSPLRGLPSNFGDLAGKLPKGGFGDIADKIPKGGLGDIADKIPKGGLGDIAGKLPSGGAGGLPSIPTGSLPGIPTGELPNLPTPAVEKRQAQEFGSAGSPLRGLPGGLGDLAGKLPKGGFGDIADKLPKGGLGDIAGKLPSGGAGGFPSIPTGSLPGIPTGETPSVPSPAVEKRQEQEDESSEEQDSSSGSGDSTGSPLSGLPGLGDLAGKLPSGGLGDLAGKLPSGGLGDLAGKLPSGGAGGLPGLPTGGLPSLPTGGLPSLPTGGLPGLGN